MSDEATAYIVQSYGYLLECTMATYESLCLKRSSSKSEIRRHESIIRTSFENMHKELAYQASVHKVYNHKWTNCVRVRDVLKLIAAEGLEHGVARYVLVHSHRK